MKRIITIICLFAGLISVSYAQFNPSRLTLGGGLGLQFGDYTVVNIAPQVGYKLSNIVTVGGGLTYTYYREKYHTEIDTNNYFGLNLFTRVYPVSFLVLSLQPEANRMWKTVENRLTMEKIKTDKLIPSCVVGVGVSMGPIIAMLKYDVVQNGDSPYGSRIFYSLGYTFEF